MARKLRVATWAQLGELGSATWDLKMVIKHLRAGGAAKRTLGKARSLLKVIQGAHRHATRAHFAARDAQAQHPAPEQH